MDDDWDLHAIVRGFSSTSSAAGATSSAATANEPSSKNPLSTAEQDCSFPCAPSFQDLFEPRRESFVKELNDLCKPFFPKSQEPSQIVSFSPQRLPVSPLSVLQDLSCEKVVRNLPQRPQIQQKQQLFSVVNGSKTSHHPRSKKRKNQLKRVCHVSAEGLSSDKWSWRKYGQKPIKGSPYPRGYYKCSTLAGCMARKQVERNRSDPGMFIITYTSDHNHPMPTHRNSLAGVSRHKPAKKASSSPEMSPVESLSPLLEKLESGPEDDDDNDDFSPSNMALDDNFFAGLEEFGDQVNVECLPGHFPTNFQFPSLAS